MKFGIISTHWMCQDFCDAVSEINGVTINSVYSRDIEKSKEFSIKNKISNYYDNYNMMLNSDIDAVYVASPNMLHYDHAVTAIISGKHVLIEKPITLNTLELEQLYDLAKKYNVMFLEAMKTMHLNEFKMLQNELKDVFDIKYCNFTQLQYSSKYDAFKEGIIANTFNNKHGGALYDIGIYCLYYPIALFGTPNSYNVSEHTLVNGVDGSGTLSLIYDDMLVDVTYSKIINGVNKSYIYGSKTIMIDNASVLSGIQVNDEILFKGQVENKMKPEIEAFYNMVRSKDNDFFETYYKLSYDVINIIASVRRSN